MKAKQNMYKDAKATVKPHSIKEGDTILVKTKSTKSKSPYDPQPFRRCRALGPKGGEDRRKAHIETNGEGRDIQKARQQDRQVKAKQKMYKDAKATVKTH